MAYTEEKIAYQMEKDLDLIRDLIRNVGFDRPDTLVSFKVELESKTKEYINFISGRTEKPVS